MPNQLPELPRLVTISPNLVAMACPIVVRTTMTTAAINTRMRAYSTMLCPRRLGMSTFQRSLDIAVRLYRNNSAPIPETNATSSPLSFELQQ